jgi:hypothetical protein
VTVTACELPAVSVKFVGETVKAALLLATLVTLRDAGDVEGHVTVNVC